VQIKEYSFSVEKNISSSIVQFFKMLEPHENCLLSQDDKARVPIGTTAANKQAPIMMHLEYRVRLPDHDWVVAERHKFFTSVYASVSIPNGCLGDPEITGYSGRTYVAIRSGKHASSTAYSHALDMDRLLSLKE
jgi:hypothetical protein